MLPCGFAQDIRTTPTMDFTARRYRLSLSTLFSRWIEKRNLFRGRGDRRGREEMKDIAHRDLDSSAAGFRGENPKRHPALSATRVRIYAVSFSSRLGVPGIPEHPSSRTTVSHSLPLTFSLPPPPPLLSRDVKSFWQSTRIRTRNAKARNREFTTALLRSEIHSERASLAAFFYIQRTIDINSLSYPFYV